MKTFRLFVLWATLTALSLASPSAAAQNNERQPEATPAPVQPEPDQQDQETASVARAEKARANKSVNVYRLDFVLSEIADGKTINTRSYSVVAREDETNKLRSGARYPIKLVPAPALSTRATFSTWI